MQKVKDAAAALGVSPNTVRVYTRRFKDYFSPAAAPPPGQARRFAPDDMTTLFTIRLMYQDGKDAEAIAAALAAGNYIEPVEPETGQEEPETKTEDAQAAPQLSPAEEAATMALKLIEGQVDSLTNERDYLRDEIEKERQARLTAEVDAARLAGQLDAIYRRHWWQLWRPERPQDAD
jgi:DNA-binding transcriptional MerR regulator